MLYLVVIWPDNSHTTYPSPRRTVALLPPLKQRPPSPNSRNAVVLFNFSIQKSNPKSVLPVSPVMTPFQPEYDYPFISDLPGVTLTALIQYPGDSNFDIQAIFFGDQRRQTGSDECCNKRSRNRIVSYRLISSK